MDGDLRDVRMQSGLPEAPGARRERDGEIVQVAFGLLPRQQHAGAVAVLGGEVGNSRGR